MDTKDISAKKRGSTGYDGYKKARGNKLSGLVDRNGPPLACAVSPVNVHDSQLYEPTLEAFEIPEVQVHPSIISTDAAYVPKKFANTIGSEQSKATSRSTEIEKISKMRKTILV